MSDGVLGEIRHNVNDFFDLFRVAVMVGIMYVVFVAPLAIVHGRASRRDMAAGVVGFAFYLFALAELARWLG